MTPSHALTGFDLIVRNGIVVTASDLMRCDIGVRSGKVVALAERLEGAARIIDAAGKHVLPGGVDGHCHLDQPMSDGSRMADDFASGTVSAACGGTTTVIPFACQTKGGSVIAAVEDYHRRAEGKALVDYAFHLIVTDPSPQVLREELPRLIADGYTSFKIYMTYDDLKLNDRQILELLALAKREGAMAMIHAENSECIAWLTDLLESAGHTAPRFHAAARPMAVEREAVHRAIALSELTEVPILIVHVSGREAVEQIQWAQNRGLRIYAETCPQYLYLTAGDLGLENFEGEVHMQSAAARPSQSAGHLGWARLGRVPGLLLRSRPVPLQRSSGQDGQGRPCAISLRAERHTRYRDPAAAAV